MTIQNKTLKNGFSIPVLGKGTWMTNIGRKPHESLRDKKRIQEIKEAIEQGISYIDTAERYANGYVEKLISQAIKGFNREKLFLASKVSSDHLDYDSVISSAKASIKRMQTTYLDLYLIHQFNPETDLSETMRAMDFLIEKKMIKNIGAFNFTVEQLKQAQSYTKNKIVANQVQYSLLQHEQENHEIIEYCQKHDIMIISSKPFQQDLLSPKTRKQLEELANKYGRTPSQIAAAWLMAQPNTVVLFKLNTINQIEKILDASHVKLDKNDMEKFSKENN